MRRASGSPPSPPAHLPTPMSFSAGLTFSRAGGKGSTRGGFTLIELLVVISLIMVLAGLAVAFLPGLNDQAKAARAGTMVQQALNIAKQKALRDQVPTGIRLVAGKRYPSPLDPQVPYFVTELQYIQQPDDFAEGTLSTVVTSGIPNLSQVQLTGASDLTSGSTFVVEYLVQPGDYLEVLGGGLVHRITTVTRNPPDPALPLVSSVLTLASQLPYQIATPTRNYRIIRGPRVTSEDLLQLPDGVAINLLTNGTYGNPLPENIADPDKGKVDILFSPSGAVITPGVTTDSINLWVHDTSDPTATPPFIGEPTIVAVFVRSGLVAAHPAVFPPAADPYQFVKDGRSR